MCSPTVPPYPLAHRNKPSTLKYQFRLHQALKFMRQDPALEFPPPGCSEDQGGIPTRRSPENKLGVRTVQATLGYDWSEGPILEICSSFPEKEF